MKLVKMSLLAATLVASSAFAIDNTKVSGDAKLYYSTADADDINLFNKAGATGQTAARVGITTDLTEGVSAGVSLTALSTLGLEGQLVNNVWEGTNGTSDSFWFDEAWIAGTVGKTTGKIGRMKLDTPLVFTETWSIAENTFEAAVVLNSDIPDTTLVAAYVGGSNGGDAFNRQVIAPMSLTANTNFSQFYNGAFAAGAINNSWEPLTVQGWYYHATSLLSTYWAQADLDIAGLQFGAQYVGLSEQASLSNKSSSAMAAKVGYEMKDTFTISGAFSKTSADKTTVQVGANLAASGQSKLYTEAWWNYGYITQADTTAINVTVTTPESLTWAELGLYVTQSTTTDGIAAGKDNELLEATLSASKSFGPLDTSLVYVMTDANDLNLETAAPDSGKAYNTVQAYLTYNF